MNADAEALEQRLQLPLLLAALLTLPALAIEEFASSDAWQLVALVLNSCIWIAFVGEMVATLRVADHRWLWLREHPLDVAIIALTPPFLPAGMSAARMFRVLRLLRLLKVASLSRRLLSTEGVRDVAVLALVTVLAGGAAFSAVENSVKHPVSPWDGVWWAITTMTTVGYGDFAPKTVAGRSIALVVMLVGIGFVAVLTASAAERFMESRREATEERHDLSAKLDEVLRRLDAMERHR